VKGDQRSGSIAAASIIAKVIRDRMMVRAGSLHNGYGFEQHMGYATALHRSCLARLGPVERLHRFSFAPLCGSRGNEEPDGIAAMPSGPFV
jgi:ribonuclease HII